MSRKVAFSPWMLLLVLLVFAAAAFGQTTASIKGTVTDASGAAVAGATVSVKNPDKGIDRTTQTNTAGDYEVPALPPGQYTVKIQAKGFEVQQANGVPLQVSQNSVQNFSLKVASTSEVITVEATAPVIEATTITVGQSIDQRTVQEIPLNGRHFVDLGLLIPGSVTPPQNGFLTAPLRGQGSFAFNTAGNREDTVNFMVNGINLNDMVQNQITFQPSINTVAEFKVDNSTYSAEYGRNSGAIVNIATRSGTNSYHGEVFEFIRNNALDARNFFNPKGVDQSAFKRNQFGAAFGGPIVKDKTFFFLSYEGTRQRQGITLNTLVLNASQRAAVVAGGNATSNAILALIPTANDPTGSRFIGSATAPVNIDQGTADISHNFNSNLRLHGYYALQHDLRQEPTLQGNSIPGFGDTRESRRQIATINLEQTLSSTLVNEARLGFNRIHITFAPNATQNPVAIGILDGNNFNAGLPQISISGTQINLGGPGGFPQGRGDTTAVLSDTLNYIRGKHSFKLGGEFRRFNNNNFNGDAGTLGFLNVADFAAGTPNAFSITPGNRPSRIAVNNLGFFAQDSWKFNQRLTLELGLRYDWNRTPTEALDRFANLIVTNGQASLVQVSSPYDQNSTNFQPRLGLSYDVFGGGKTIVRAAYAILTDQPITNLVTGLTSNPPFGSPQNFVPSGTKPKTSYATLLPDAAASGLSPTTVDPNFQNSYVESYNLNIQHQVTNNWSLMVGYFGSSGRHLRTRVNPNQFLLDAQGHQILDPATNKPIRPFANLSASSPISPNAAVGNISENVSNGNSSYNALWVTSNLRPWHGFQFNASYTYSKSLDYTSQNGQGVVIQNSLNAAGDRGLSDFDARNRFSMNFIYDLPAFRHNRLFEGWQIGSIIQSQSGNPVSLLANANAIAGYTGLATLRPDLIGPVQIVNTPNTTGGITYFSGSVCDPFTLAPATQCPAGTAFAIPDVQGGTSRVFHFGNMGRDVIIGPGFNNVDFSLVKRTKINERFRHEMRVEAFDLFNHPNFGQPGRVAQVGSGTFGVISSTRFPIGDSGSARQLQFAMKLLF
jgi:outer membrane receptor protein involved in Fe transport